MDEDARALNEWEDIHTLGHFTFKPDQIHPCPESKMLPNGQIEDPLWVTRPLDKQYAASIVQLAKTQGIVPKSNIMLVVHAPELFQSEPCGPLSNRIPPGANLFDWIVSKNPMPFSGGHTTLALKKQYKDFPMNKLWNSVPNIKVLAVNLDRYDHVSGLRKLGRRANIGTSLNKKMDTIHIIRDVHRTLLQEGHFRQFVEENGEIYPMKDEFIRRVMAEYNITKKEDQETKISSFRSLTRMSKTWGEEWDTLDAIFDCMVMKAKDAGGVTSGTTFYDHIWNLPRKIRIDLLDDNANEHMGIPRAAELKAAAEQVRSRAFIHNHIVEVYCVGQALLQDPKLFTNCFNFEDVIKVVPALGKSQWIDKLYQWAKANAGKKAIPERFGEEVTSFMIHMSSSEAAMKLKVPTGHKNRAMLHRLFGLRIISLLF